jgi:hypothetical protein
MIYLQQIIIGFLLGWFATQFEPFKWLLKPIKQYGIYVYLYKLVSCPKCSTFWITLIYTQNILIAITASFIADVYDRNFNIIRI